MHVSKIKAPETGTIQRRWIMGLVSATALLAMAVPPAFAAVWTVDDDLQDLATADYQYIQQAIDDASSGDEIVIYPGHYYEQLVINNWDPITVKDLVLTSTDPDDPSVVAATIVDADVPGAGADRVIRMCGYETEDTRIEGLTLQNGYVTSGHGGGILGGASQQGYRAAAVVSRCVIKDCTASGCTGGGLACLDGRVEYCTFIDNTAYQGGAISYCGNSTVHTETLIKGNDIGYNTSTDWGGGLYWCYAIIEDNDIHHNEAGTKGGGMYWIGAADIRNNRIFSNEAGTHGGACAELGEADIYNNLVFDNYAVDNGGAFYDTMIMNVRHNTVYGNVAGDYGGAFYDQSAREHADKTVIENNIIWGNTATAGGEYNSAQIYITDGMTYLTLRNNIIQNWTGADNLPSDPLLIDPDGADNDLSTAADNDFHIPSNSPATDAGVDCGISNDYERDERPCGDANDIGADEHPGYLSWDGSSLDGWIPWTLGSWEVTDEDDTDDYFRNTILTQAILFRANYCSDGVIRFSYCVEDLPATAAAMTVSLRLSGETANNQVRLAITSGYMDLGLKTNGTWGGGVRNFTATTVEGQWYDMEAVLDGPNVTVSRRPQGGAWVTTHTVTTAPEGTSRIQFVTSNSAVVRIDDITIDGIREASQPGGAGGPEGADGFDSGLVGWTTSGTWTTSTNGEDDAYAIETSGSASVYMLRSTIPGTTTPLPDDFELYFSYKADEYARVSQYIKVSFRKSTGLSCPSVGIWPHTLNVAFEDATNSTNQNYSTEPGKWYDVRIVCEGTQFTVERREQNCAWELIHSHTTTVTEGDQIEFRIANDGQYKIDDVAVVAR